MSGVTWRNVSTQAKAEDVLAFFNKADIGSVIFGMDEMIIKDGIFSTMKKFSDNADVQNRSLQLLQDCQILSPKGITNDELAYRFDVLLQTLSNCIDRTDVLCHLFELLAMVADKKAVKERCIRTEETELLHLVGHSLEIHQKSKDVQRSGLQLYEAILNNASEKSQKTFAKKMFRAVGENLQKNNDDPAICYSSYSILCTLADKMGDKLAPWIERILGMILTSISQLFSGELVAKCMVLLEKLATDQDALYAMASHPRSLRVFTDALGILDVSHLSASITALEYLLRILEDDNAVQLVMENIIEQHIKPLRYFKTVKAEVDSKADKFAKLVAEAHSVDEGAMQYWLQLLDFINNILNDMIRELEAEYPETESDAEQDAPQAPAKPAAASVVSTPAPTSAAVDTRKPSSATAGVVPLVENPLARKTASKHDDAAALAASIAAEQARVAQALQTVSAAEQQRNTGTSSPALIPIDSHKHRSFVYEEPDGTNSAGLMADSDSATGSRKERVVGTSFPTLSAVAAITTQPAKSIIPPTAASAMPVTAAATSIPTGSMKGPVGAQVPVVAAVAVPIGIPGNSPTPPGPKSDIPVVMAMAADRAGANGDSFGSTKNAQLLAGVRWENLEVQFDVMVVEAFLNTCDLGTAILTMDTGMVKGALFAAMRNFPDDSVIQCKCIQLLQECQLLSPKGVTNDELTQHFDLLLHVVSDFTDQPALIAALFEFLTMVADRKPVRERCSRTEDTELLHYVGKALELHRPDKSVQRAGLQLYEAILQHASEKSQKTFAKKIFRAVGENLQKNNDDPAICYSSYSILCTLTDKMGDKLAPWIERILGLVLTSITQLYSAELVAKCLLLLEKIATDHDSLFVMAAHPRCLRVFTDALGILDTRYMSATITALEYLLRILEDDTSMSVVLENLDGQKVAHLEYFRKLQDELSTKSDKFLDLAAQANDVDDGAMQYWLQLLEQINNIIVEYMRELGKGTEAVQQAATTPGLLPTIEEHGSESEDESIEAFDEKKDDCAPGFIHGHTTEVESAPVEQEADGEDINAMEAERIRLQEEEEAARIAAEQAAEAEAEAARIAAEEAAEEEAQAEAARIAAAEAEAVAEAAALAELRAEEQRRLQIAKEEAAQREKRAAEAARAAERLELERLTAERAEAARLDAIAAEEERVAERARQAEAALLEEQRQAEAAALEAERVAAEAEEEALILAAEAELRAEDAAAAAEDAACIAEEEAAEAEALALAEEEALLLAEEEALEAECAAIAAAEAQKQAEQDALEVERLAASHAEALRVAEEEALQAEYAVIAAAEAQQRAEAAKLEAERRAAEEALSKEEELLQIENQKIVSAQRAAAAEKLRLATIQREAEEAAARVESERLAAIAQAEADRLVAEEQERAIETARLEAERATLAAQAEQERLDAERAVEEARLQAERAAEEERQMQAVGEAEELAARTKADRVAAEKLAAEQQVAKVAKERAAARVAAEKEAQRERAAQQAAERAARLAAAEEAKRAVEAKRAERLAAEKAATLAAEEKRITQQREREAKAAAEKAARIAAAQQALQEAKEKLEREHAEKVAAERAIAQAAEERLLEIQRAREEQALAAQRAKEEKAAADKAERIALAQQAVAEAKEKRVREMARKEAAAHTAMAAVSFSAHASKHAEFSHESKQSTSSGSHVASDIASELLHSPVPAAASAVTPASEPVADERKGLKRGESWRAANVPFVSSTVKARIAAEKEAEESRRVQELQKLADESRWQAQGAMLRAEDMHRLYLGAEKKMENLTVENSELAQRANKKETHPITSGSNAVPVDKRAQGAGQGRYASVLLTSAATKQPPSPPSPVRKSMTQSTGFLQMESETLDLHSPQESVRPHSVPAQSHSQVPLTAHPVRSPLPTESSPRRQRSSTHEVSRSRSPVRRSHSVPDMHADKDEVRTVDPDEVARREARAERLRKIVYPINGRSTERISTPSAQEEKVSKQALAVAGVLEAFAQLTVPSANAITGFGSASVKVSHGSLRHPHSRNNSPTANLLHATGIYGSFASPQGGDSNHSVRFQENQSPEPSQSSSTTPARRSLTAMEAQYNEVVHASEGPVMQECAQNIAILFRRLKETTKNNFNGKTDAVIGLPLMKLCIRRLGLVDAKTFPNNEADILLFHLGVKQLTLFGFALAVTLCAERALHSPLEGELGATTYIPKSYMGVVDFLNQKMLKLFARMDSEHVQKTTSFNPLDDYREIAPESQHEVMRLLEREKKVFYTIYESYLPKSVKGFADMKAALSAAPLTGGLPFSGVVNFGRDFEMSPHLLSRAQLLEIFNSILFAERELVQQHSFGSPDGSARHSNSNGAFGTTTPGSSGKLHVETSSSWAGMGRDSSQKSANSAFSAPSMAAKADPADSISFPQFLDFILLVALRCPMFRGTASPVVKLSNLMLLLNQSQGKHILAKKFRAKELVVFRVNPVFAMATSYRAAQEAATTSPHPTAGAGVDTGDQGTYLWGDDAATESILDGERHLLKNPTRSHSPSRGEIRISPTSKAFKPSTVPFYDIATQSVVQIRRKKPMAELRGKLSDSH